MTPIARPRLAPPSRDAHKYSRGLVAVVQGEMPGAAMLAARAAMHGGAGYVKLVGQAPTGGQPDALVRVATESLADVLADDRLGALVIGPGLGHGSVMSRWLSDALASDRPLVVDGDALTALGSAAAERLAGRPAPTILTPHSGEFDRMFGASDAAKPDRTLVAARATGAVIVHKGADTLVAAPDGRIAGKSDAPSWLSTAGTGDVLAGLTGARLAAGLDPFEAACEAVWLHARVAELAGPAFIADDLVPLVPRAIGECLTR